MAGWLKIAKNAGSSCLKQAHNGLVLGEFRQDDLDGDGWAAHDLVAAENLSHPARCDLFVDFEQPIQLGAGPKTDNRHDAGFFLWSLIDPNSPFRPVPGYSQVLLPWRHEIVSRSGVPTVTLSVPPRSSASSIRVSQISRTLRPAMISPISGLDTCVVSPSAAQQKMYLRSGPGHRQYQNAACRRHRWRW